MNVNRRRRFSTRKMEHRRKKQGVKVNDVLPDEMHLLDLCVVHEGIEILQGSRLFMPVMRGLPDVEMMFECRQVSDRRVEPDVKILVRGVRDGDTKVRGVAGDIPVGELGLGLFAQPLPDLVRDFGLDRGAILCRYTA